MSWRCGRCGRPIEREDSIRAGLGPVCRKVLSKQMPPEQFRCYKGFACLPSVEYHVPTLLARANRRYKVYGIEWDGEAEKTIIDELGIERERIKVNLEEDIKRLEHEHLIKNGVLSYTDSAMLRKEAYRRRRVCPFGLDCRNPEEALNAVYTLIARAIEHMETKDPELPLVDAIDSLLDLLQVLGFDEREHYMQLEKELKKSARKKYANKFADDFIDELFEDSEE